MSVRVYEFSKKRDIPTKELLKVLRENNLEVPSHMSVLSEEALTFLDNFFKKDVQQQKEVKNTMPSMPEQQDVVKSTSPGISPKVEVKEEVISKAFEKKSFPADQAVKKHEFVVEPMTVGEFCQKAHKSLGDVMLVLIKQGMLTTKNTLLAEKSVALLATYYEIPLATPVQEKKQVDTSARRVEIVGHGAKEERLPIVVVMGHVDHGKTTLLDYIRKTRVAAKEKGGITQHLGAYEVKTAQGGLVFLDTPGHEAFSMMRIRGAKVADIAVLVVAADDGMMPQTIEALRQARSAGLTIVVALNKIDKVSPAHIESVKKSLAQYDLVPEDWGGQTVVIPLSAKTGVGVDALLEMLVLQGQMMELTAHIDMPAQGFILESKLEKGRGPVATVICHNGILRVGDYFVVGKTYGKVTSLFDSSGKKVHQIYPSVPASVSGFNEMPSVGDEFKVVPQAELKKSRAAIEIKPTVQAHTATKDTLLLIVKTEGLSSQEALLAALDKLSVKMKKQIMVIHAGIGAITESDVVLAEDTGALIYGLHVKTDSIALALAQKAKITILLFDIIYKLLEEIEAKIEAAKPIKMIRKKIGEASVLKVFDIKNLGVIAGAHVINGRFSKDGTVVVYRGKHKVGEGAIKSLQRDKKTVKEVHTGFECAFLVTGFDSWQPEDRVECYLETPEL
jgi:translation initiation factor IF-2